MTTGVIQGFFPNGVSRGPVRLAANADPTARGGPGTPLPAAVRQRMESLFGTSFADVRLHVGTHPQSIGALAFTRGNHVHLATGQYDAATGRGERILVHELAHVVQQRAGRVRNPFGAGVAIVQDPLLEAEADRMSRRLAAQQPAPPRAASGPTLQRKTAGGCGCGTAHPKTKSECGLRQLPPQIATRVLMLANGPDPLDSVRRFSSAFPGLIAQMKMLQNDCGCGCGGTCSGAGKNAIVQRAGCNRGNGQVEWYTRTGAQVRASIQHHHQQNVSSDIAHVLCCAFCEAFIRSWSEGGGAVGAAGRFPRFTALFEHYVHQYHANYAPGAGRQVYTEEAYWVPVNAALCGAAIGLAAANAYLIDAVFVGAVRAFINATIGVVLGGAGYPTGMPMPLALQATFDHMRGALLAEIGAAPPAIAAGGQRRSYASATIRLSRVYNLLRLIGAHAPTAAGTEWEDLRALRGRMRVLDFAAIDAGGNPAVADAKFSYQGGRPPDDWGPGQAADQAAIYSTMAGAVGAATIPVITFDVCGCNLPLMLQMMFNVKKDRLEKNRGKRRQDDLDESAEKRYRNAVYDSKFINSATVKWVKKPLS